MYRLGILTQSFDSEYEDDTEDGICSACGEHASPVYAQDLKTGELAEFLGSNCCGYGFRY